MPPRRKAQMLQDLEKKVTELRKAQQKESKARVRLLKAQHDR